MAVVNIKIYVNFNRILYVYIRAIFCRIKLPKERVIFYIIIRVFDYKS